MLRNAFCSQVEVCHYASALHLSFINNDEGAAGFLTLHWAEQCTVKWDPPLPFFNLLTGKIEYRQDFFEIVVIIFVFYKFAGHFKIFRFVEEMNQNNDNNCKALTICHRQHINSCGLQPLIETETQ